VLLGSKFILAMVIECNRALTSELESSHNFPLHAFMLHLPC